MRRSLHFFHCEGNTILFFLNIVSFSVLIFIFISILVNYEIYITSLHRFFISI